MDEDEYRRTRDQFIARPCPFQAALFSGIATCRLAERVQLAERQAVNCVKVDAQARCRQVFDLLRSKAGFALGRARISVRMPFGQAVKIQCGGLLGLRDALYGGAAGDVADVDGLLTEIAAHFGGFDAVQFDAVVRRIAHYRHRESSK